MIEWEREIGLCLTLGEIVKLTVGQAIDLLATAIETPDYETHRFRHWGPGWFEIVVVRPGSACAREALEIASALEKYPVLDDSDASQREYDDTVSNIADRIRDIENSLDNYPDPEWDVEAMAAAVFSDMWDHDQGELEPQDDRGGYPSEESVEASLERLGYLR